VIPRSRSRRTRRGSPNPRTRPSLRSRHTRRGSQNLRARPRPATDTFGHSVLTTRGESRLEVTDHGLGNLAEVNDTRSPVRRPYCEGHFGPAEALDDRLRGQAGDSEFADSNATACARLSV
jgi:hypothetical protein